MKITRKQLRKILLNEARRIIVGQNKPAAESKNRGIIKKIMSDTLYDDDQNFHKIKELIRAGLNDPDPASGELSMAQGVSLLQGVSFMYPEYEDLVMGYAMPSDIDDARLQDLKTKKLLDQKAYEEIYPRALKIAKDLNDVLIMIKQGHKDQFNAAVRSSLTHLLIDLKRQRGGRKAVADATAVYGIRI